LLSKDSVHLRCRIQPYQAAPDGLGAREAVAFSSHVATHACNHKYGLAYGRGFIGRNGRFVHIAAQSLPLDILEEYSAGCVGRLPAEHHKVIDAPGDHHIHTETGFQTIGCFELAVLNPTTAFEGTVEDLDAPASRIPFHPLLGIRKVFYRNRGEKHPFNGFVFCFPFQDINRPHPDGFRITFGGGAQFHFGKPDIKPGIAGLTRTAMRNIVRKGGQLPTIHVIPCLTYSLPRTPDRVRGRL